VKLAFAITDAAPESSHRKDDADLLALSAKGNRLAFTALVERLHPMVYRVVWRLTSGHADTEDIAQEAFVRLWKHASELRDAHAIKSWLLKVASNIAMDRHRGLPAGAQGEAEDVADVRPLAEETVMVSWAQQRIDRAIHALPERQRLALTLTHFEQQPNATAADIMGITVDALESLLSRARRALKETLSADKAELLSAVQMEGR
jgi:RNA polymerase sigma-70 factor, ECF subfamily